MTDSAERLGANQTVSLIAGPLAGGLVFLFFGPEDLSQEGQLTAAIAVLMAVWWATEAIPVAVTAFLPLILFPILGIAPIATAAPFYAHPTIYLFLGGFLIALAIERAGLHRRVALLVFNVVGVNGSSLIGGFMIAAAVLSMWISNTSTTLMLLPIVMSVIVVIRETISDLSSTQRRDFETAMLLGLAYGATLGGMTTLVGTPPNAFLSGFMSSTYGIEIDFARWMMVGMPLAIIMLPITWFLLTRVMFKVNFKSSAAARKHVIGLSAELGPIKTGEIRIAIVFALLVVGWVARKPIAELTGVKELSDAGVAMLAATLAFIVPSGSRPGALVTWEDTKRLPWGVLILFGGGLALAGGMTSSGLTLWIGQQLAPLGAVHSVLLIVAATALVIFLTELTSNLATTATLLPVVAAMAIETGNDPMIFVIPITLAASCAFMLPVATPPNAIVFSSGYLSIPRMMRAGFVLNIIGIVVLSVISLTLVPMVF